MWKKGLTNLSRNAILIMSRGQGFSKLQGKVLSLPKKVWKVFKNLLTTACHRAIINSRGEGKAVPQRERPTRVSKTYSRWPDRKVFLFAVYKCEPDHAGWKNVVDTQDTQATLHNWGTHAREQPPLRINALRLPWEWQVRSLPHSFLTQRPGFCPLPINGVECRRIK